MPRSRAPRRRLAAALLLVLGVLAAALCGPASTASAAPAPGAAAKKASAPAFTDGSAAPGCKQGGRHQDSDPAAPVRARTAHDQAPVLADRGAPAALCGLYAAHRNPPVRGPTLTAPGPVELSVLRV
ncbi:hypothetical protein [Streptomyces sp. SDr-06]|uniref:hypothetical protein n=1 Tax=Streptomyces sp. SDr-06 TaxID=2267702 RepID=UPI000DEABAFB|nr:hypothetical protein [Streptomyces sp. SDr-06]RCH61939.1 hypothetical protein DT019_35670 [Streptomyces sp. SDr-06]